VGGGGAQVAVRVREVAEAERRVRRHRAVLQERGARAGLVARREETLGAAGGGRAGAGLPQAGAVGIEGEPRRGVVAAPGQPARLRQLEERAVRPRDDARDHAVRAAAQHHLARTRLDVRADGAARGADGLRQRGGVRRRGEHHQLRERADAHRGGRGGQRHVLQRLDAVGVRRRRGRARRRRRRGVRGEGERQERGERRHGAAVLQPACRRGVGGCAP
jgi:hypothetical protein